jgi:putative cardiolipin synthase
MKFPERLALIVMLSILGACATVPVDYPKTPSTALEDTQGTYYGARVAALTSAHPEGRSGFYVLDEGIDALAARLILARRAERSIDAQYFLIQGDLVGFLFVDALLEAADRGVRVRLLLDDILTVGDDTALAAIQSHPNFELRIFNPFAHRSSARYFELLTDFSRVDHRMHNKAFTVDNQVTIVGGRNIGDEYFDANREFEFADVDLLALGPVAKEVSVAFDTYWNSEFAVPVEALVGAPADPDALQEFRKSYASILEAESNAHYREALDSTIIDNMLSAQLPLFWGMPTVVYDDPDKVVDPIEDVVTVRSELRPKVLAAESELLVVSPYFVPLNAGVDGFRSLRDRGVRVVVLTNSLASTDMIPMQAGYANYRKELLEMGVEIYEVKPDAGFEDSNRSGYDFSHSALHAKVFIIDRRFIFVGSFNWDPRSSFLNTEMGLFVDSPALAEWGAEKLTSRLPGHAYRVRLNEAGEVEWVDASGQDEIIFDEEPLAGFWRRFSAGIYGILPIEDEL